MNKQIYITKAKIKYNENRELYCIENLAYCYAPIAFKPSYYDYEEHFYKDTSKGRLREDYGFEIEEKEQDVWIISTEYSIKSCDCCEHVEDEAFVVEYIFKKKEQAMAKVIEILGEEDND